MLKLPPHVLRKYKIKFSLKSPFFSHKQKKLFSFAFLAPFFPFSAFKGRETRDRRNRKKGGRAKCRVKISRKKGVKKDPYVHTPTHTPLVKRNPHFANWVLLLPFPFFPLATHPSFFFRRERFGNSAVDVEKRFSPSPSPRGRNALDFLGRRKKRRAFSRLFSGKKTIFWRFRAFLFCRRRRHHHYRQKYTRP